MPALRARKIKSPPGVCRTGFVASTGIAN
jgi:hypothetical protein